MSTNDRLAKLEAENEELRARLAKLEPKEPKPEFKPKPWQPIDYTAGVSMDRATMLEFAAAASAGGIANDAWRRMEPSSIIPKEPKVEEPKARGVPSERGYVEPAPLEMPPGVKIIDEMMKAEDVVWRRELAKKLSGE